MSFLPKNTASASGDGEFKPASHIKYVVVSIAIILAVGTIVLVYFLIKDRLFSQSPEEQLQEEAIPVLPPNLNDPAGDNGGNGQEGVKAEELLFGSFYARPAADYPSGFADYKLPINAKNDVLNYYNVSRKIDLDSVLEDLNKYGFAEIKNPFPAKKDFFSLYQELYKQEVPILISGDFLFYYFQNSLKSIYKNIEKEIFYNTIWSASKKLFDSAEARYKLKVSLYGQISDPEVEGSRLAAAYWATVLELLKPEKNQTSADKDKNKFSVEEQGLYGFTVPEYLRVDVGKEVQLIKLAEEKTKSPVKRYEVDYAAYSVPENYRRDAKLNNFFQASRWMNSVLPINFKSDDCPNCLLDKEDWRIGMVAAGLIAGDFAKNQEVKNQWAKIYKIISFFSGLRNDLTYLSYDAALREQYGENYDLNLIFSPNNEKRNEELEKLRGRLSGIKFSSLESGLSRDKPENKPYLGFRVLAEPYWPNEYIFQKLTYPYIGKFTLAKPNRDTNLTACETNEKTTIRCRVIALDIINLIRPISEDPYFTENTSYENYGVQAKELTDLLDEFNDNTWHSNIFWIALAAGKSYLKADSGKMPAFARSQKWDGKLVSTAIGAWMNAQLPGDSLLRSVESNNAGGFSNLYRCNEYNYIEPNLPLIRELSADSKMLFDFFEQLQMYDKQDIVKNDLSEMKDTLENLERIAVKELSGEAISSQEYCYLENLVNGQYVEKAGEKSAKISLLFQGRQVGLKQSLSGLKLIATVHKKGDSLVISAGPAFVYSESK